MPDALSPSLEEEPNQVEKFLTLRAAAEILGVPAFKMYRAAKRNQFPVYRFGNNRALVRISEVLAAIERLSAGM